VNHYTVRLSYRLDGLLHNTDFQVNADCIGEAVPIAMHKCRQLFPYASEVQLIYAT